MKKNQIVALEIALVGVIVYLWLNRCKKNKAIEQAKLGAETPA